MKKRWEELIRRYWPPGKEQLLILVLLGLLLAVIAIPADRKEEDSQEKEETALSGEEDTYDMNYESRMEQRLEELLGSVDGVGKVRVMLTFEGTGEKKVEKDESITADESRKETVYEEHGSSERTPYVTSETNPRVEGILVIAQGGGNSRVKQEILEAAQALFGIDAHKIKIMKMEESK